MSEMVVPDGWDVSELRKHSTRVKLKNSVGNTNILTASAQHGLINQRKFFNKSVASKDTSNYTLLFRGDFAYNKSYSEGYPVGVVRRLSRYDSGILSPLYICFTISSDDCEVDFMSYFFDSYWFDRELNSVVQEGARAHGLLNIPVNDFFSRELLLPPLPEQQKIASILTSVDEVIEKTQSQINKLQDLKKGTMNELLTKGIGHTEFKDSPVGKIPKGWEVKSLSEVTINHDSKRVPVKSIDRQDMQGVYRYYGASGIIDYVDDYLFDGQYILMGEDGENVLSRNLPLAFIVNGKFWVNNHAHIFQPKDGVDIGFLCEFLESLDYKNIASGSAQPKITKSSLNKIKVLSPPLPEQQKIASILSSMDSHIEEKQRKLEQTQSLKKSLMQDLLTGKVRVTVN